MPSQLHDDTPRPLGLQTIQPWRPQAVVAEVEDRVRDYARIAVCDGQGGGTSREQARRVQLRVRAHPVRDLGYVRVVCDLQAQVWRPPPTRQEPVRRAP